MMGGTWPAASAGPPAQSLQQRAPQPKAFTSQINVTPDLLIDQNTKSLKVEGGSVDLFGQEIKLPALPFELPANPALNSLQAIYPGALPAAATAVPARKVSVRASGVQAPVSLHALLLHRR